MHEFTTVNNIVQRVIEVSQEEGAKEILRLEIGLGEFTPLEKEQMEFWLNQMLSETELGKSTEVVLNRIRGLIKCKGCGYEGTLETSGLDHFFPILKCPKCGSHNLEILKGDDCIIQRLEIDK
ncbi:MAG: hydrogenase/urease maturation nickel metallochaperone HypA [candidate division WOR-3 bacterium]|nr:hydrogenase/urease maturation nickel metallochaperone HypA [candidate division WOR-3 bacterium]